MKVLILAQYFPPDFGGASARVSNIVKGLLKANCNVTIVAAFPHYPKGNVPENYKRKAIMREQFYGAKLYRVWIPAIPHNSLLKRLALHMCFVISSLFALPFVGDTDIVWAANPNLFSFFPSLIFAASKRAPIVRNVDDLWPEVFYEMGFIKSQFLRKLLDLITWFSYSVPAAITPISEGYKRSIVSTYKIPPNKINVIQVGFENIKPLVKMQQKDYKFCVMYSGVLGLGYDFDIVLEAAKSMRDNKNIVFVIRGVGEMFSSLKASINASGLKNVILDDRFLSNDELFCYLSSADVFILPMISLKVAESGMPSKIFEYQAYGKPIICISEGEPARYINSTASGLVVKPKDVVGFTNAVIRLYKDEALRLELGLNGQRFLRENLTSQKIGERMYSLFASLQTNRL